MAKAGCQEWFAFDMSGPDTLVCHRHGIPFYTRHSDIETQPILYDDAQGVWLDSFGEDNWIRGSVIGRHLKANKKVCIVSSDLHKREPKPLWKNLIQYSGLTSDDLMLCTDYPEDAQRFFQHINQHAA